MLKPPTVVFKPFYASSKSNSPIVYVRTLVGGQRVCAFRDPGGAFLVAWRAANEYVEAMNDMWERECGSWTTLKAWHDWFRRAVGVPVVEVETMPVREIMA